MKEKEPLPEIDESLLTKEQKEELAKKQFSWKYLIFPGVILVLMVACIIVIVSLSQSDGA